MPEKKTQEVKAEPEVKEKNTKAPKGEVKGTEFCRKLFSLDTMAIILSMVAIFLGMFIHVLPNITSDTANIESAMTAFVMIAYIFTFAALICEVISLCRVQKFEVRISLILILLAFFVVCL